MNFEELDAFQWTSLAETKRQQRKKKKKGSSRARLSRRLAVCITMEKTFAWGRLFLFLCSPCVCVDALPDVNDVQPLSFGRYYPIPSMEFG